MVLAPWLSVKLRFQFAVLDPDAVPPIAPTPFTVTDEIPLLPCPESEAVPNTFIVLFDTICPSLWLSIDRLGPVESTEGVTVSCRVAKLFPSALSLTTCSPSAQKKK